MFPRRYQLPPFVGVHCFERRPEARQSSEEFTRRSIETFGGQSPSQVKGQPIQSHFPRAWAEMARFVEAVGVEVTQPLEEELVLIGTWVVFLDVLVHVAENPFFCTRGLFTHEH